MNVRDLVPWNRDRQQSMVPQNSETSPFLSLHREMNRLFDDVWRDFSAPGLMGRGGWPSVDVAETDDEYRVTAELPGLEENDVEVSLRENVLSLSGEKRIEHDEADRGRNYRERFHGRFHRTIPLPQEIDGERVSASFRNGLLTVVLPKNKAAQPAARRIPIQKVN